MISSITQEITPPIRNNPPFFPGFWIKKGGVSCVRFYMFYLVSVPAHRLTKVGASKTLIWRKKCTLSPWDILDLHLNFESLDLEVYLISWAPLQDSQLSMSETFISGVYSYYSVINAVGIQRRVERRVESKTEIPDLRVWPLIKEIPLCLGFIVIY